MRFTYRTEYANQLQQLLVSVSKHLYKKKEGLVAYQEKPFEVGLDNYHKSHREHLVYYILRDHFSGNFFFRIATVHTLFPLATFLHETWNNGDRAGLFRGMPDVLWVPKTIATAALFDGLQKLGVEADYPPSGFASGIRVIRDLEERLYYWLSRHSVHTLENMARDTEDILRSILSHSSQGDRQEQWSEHLPPGHPRRPPVYAEFLQAFPVSNEETPLPLLPPGGEWRRGESAGLPVPPARPIRPARPTRAQPEFSSETLEKAQAIAYEAWEAADRERAIALAHKALKICPYCADAYNLLAGESGNEQEKTELYQKAVDAGKTALGTSYFRKHVGRFWSLLETRPFMRAMEGLAGCFWKKGRTGEAITLFQELLRLNPGDNQGVRYLLLSALLEEDRMVEAARHIRDHDERTCSFAYAKALWSFCTAGPGGRSDLYLRDALIINPHVPAYLLGEKSLPYQDPDYYSLGDEREAVWYLHHAMKAWKQRPEALTWLRGTVRQGKANG